MDSIFGQDRRVLIFIICFSNFTFQFMIYLKFAEKAYTLKKNWFKILGNYLLIKYNNLICKVNEKILLIITKKCSLIFSQTHNAISIQQKKIPS